MNPVLDPPEVNATLELPRDWALAMCLDSTSETGTQWLLGYTKDAAGPVIAVNHGKIRYPLVMADIAMENCH